MKAINQLEFLDKIRAHDEVAIEELYRVVGAGLYSHVLKNSGTKTEAKDLIQDSMMAMYMNITKPDFELTSSLATYVQAIGHRLWLKHLERYKNRYKPDNRI